MRFSVIITAYNAVNRIATTLNSIRFQTFTDYELIVVCDSCIDNTKQIAEGYSAIVIESQYGNPGLAKKPALDIAKGEFILFIDDDDWFTHAQAFEMLDAKIRETKADILCFGFIMGKLGYKKPLDNGGRLFPAQWSKAWRRSFIGKTRFTKDILTQEVIFSNTIFNKNPKIMLWDSPIYFHDWMRVGSITEVASNGDFK